MVFEHEKPVFAIVYYGRIGPEVRETAPVYAFLREALRLAPTELPVRGPRDYAKESLHYRNSWNGDLAGFSGEEQIEQDKQLIYLGVYGGGLIALRSG